MDEIYVTYVDDEHVDNHDYDDNTDDDHDNNNDLYDRACNARVNTSDIYIYISYFFCKVIFFRINNIKNVKNKSPEFDREAVKHFRGKAANKKKSGEKMLG